MSRLPLLHSSPEHRPYVPTMTLKRKPDSDDYEATDQPCKLPAISAYSSRPLKPSRTPNVGPPALTKPRAPTLSTSSTSRALSRATSAPPRSTNTAVRVPVNRITSNPTNRLPNKDDKRFHDLQSRVTSIESARAADTASMAATLASEREKIEELQTLMSHQLAASKSKEQESHRTLSAQSAQWDSDRHNLLNQISTLESSLQKFQREVRERNEDLRLARDDLERERESVKALKAALAQQSTAQLAFTTQIEVLKAQNSAVQSTYGTSVSENTRLHSSLEEANARITELEAEGREAESIRRKLHNAVQELKGNIRVFCRVRPVLESDLMRGAEGGLVKSTSTATGDGEDGGAKWAFPDKRDKKEICVETVGENAEGKERKETFKFGFDRVFEPQTTQEEVFEEVSQLAQSCTDGYNVCIFAYGQTGSGKSWTMEGGVSDGEAGMIPRAVEQVFRVTDELKNKGWEYKMEGQFLEIYNETINDLLGSREFDKTKHEIKHLLSSRSGVPYTKVTDITVVPLRTPSQVRNLLHTASKRRSVACTLMNERSSRSHSVFTLKICGRNDVTGEECEGSLNLVDLAGSERLKEVGHGQQSGGKNGEGKERLKETQSINKSLSALGDVIAALGSGGSGEKHVPYRNSKLTYLLQNSLSGNSKTLMVLNLSPMAAHLNESLTSLRFATKVNNTTLGTAKKQTRSS